MLPALLSLARPSDCSAGREEVDGLHHVAGRPAQRELVAAELRQMQRQCRTRDLVLLAEYDHDLIFLSGLGLEPVGRRNNAPFVAGLQDRKRSVLTAQDELSVLDRLVDSRVRGVVENAPRIQRLLVEVQELDAFPSTDEVDAGDHDPRASALIGRRVDLVAEIAELVDHALRDQVPDRVGLVLRLRPILLLSHSFGAGFSAHGTPFGIVTVLFPLISAERLHRMSAKLADFSPVVKKDRRTGLTKSYFCVFLAVLYDVILNALSRQDDEGNKIGL